MNTVDELIEAVHTKRYTRARVRRLLTYVLLDIPRDFQLPQNIHVLGFTKQGQQHLAKVKDKLVTRIEKNHGTYLRKNQMIFIN